MTPATRLVLGLAALALLGAGAGLAMWGEDGWMGEVLVRGGLVLGAWWLVGPLLRRPSGTTMVMGAIAAAILFRPRLAIPILVALVVWRLAGRRDSSPSS